MNKVWEHIDHIAALLLIIGGFIVVLVLKDDKAWALLGAAAAWCFRSGVSARHPGQGSSNTIGKNKAG